MKTRQLSILFALLLAPAVLHGQARDDQFKKDAFSQNYSDTSKQAKTDSSQLFSFRQYFGSLAHKRPGQIQNLAMGSAVFVGGGQIYNRQYWKLPLVYGGIGAGLVWWGSLMDLAVHFKVDRKPDPGKATIYSILFPCLGQVYNGEYWKIPIYWGGMACGAYYYKTNRKNYERYKWIFDQANSTEEGVEKPPVSAENAKYYRDVFRRYRDYSILATALFYVVQVVDANVFAYMQDFEMDDDISLRVEPTVITPEFATAPSPALGVGLTLRF